MALESFQSQKWTDLCLTVVRTSTECADWCIQNNPDGSMTACIRNCLDAGDLAHATARVMARESPHMRTMIEACSEALERCATTCEEHREAHDVVKRCATACREAVEALRTVQDRQSNSPDAGRTAAKR